MFDAKPRPERGLLRTVVIGIFVLALPIALITTTLRVVISEQAVYDYAVRDYGAERASGIPESELIQANEEIRNYLARLGPGPLAPQVTDNAGETVSLFTAKEISHMADVRSLVQLMFKVQMISVAIVLTLAVVLIMLWPARVLAAATLWAGLLMTSVLAMVGAARDDGLRWRLVAVPPDRLHEQPVATEPADRSPDPDVPRGVLAGRLDGDWDVPAGASAWTCRALYDVPGANSKQDADDRSAPPRRSNQSGTVTRDGRSSCRRTRGTTSASSRRRCSRRRSRRSRHHQPAPTRRTRL